MKEFIPGVFHYGNRLAVENLVKDYNPFSERLFSEDGKQFREWDPHRSKLGAAFVKGVEGIDIVPGSSWLYLGIAHGYTSSFVACVLGKNGIIYGVEFSDRCFRDLTPICKKYQNIVPILADARYPEKYGVYEKVDVVFCDIADRQQTEIAARNCDKYLKSGGLLMLSIKSRSIDVVEPPKKIVKQEVEKLRKLGFEIVDWKMLDPLEKDHGFVVARISSSMSSA